MTVETIAALRDTFLRRIDAHEVYIGVIGLGYVGLPLALAFANEGFRVVGFDVDAEKVAPLKPRRELHRPHRRGAHRRRGATAARFEATADFARLREPDAILICVPTPLTRQREPDMRYIVETTECHRGAAAPRAAGRARIDDLSRHHRRAGARGSSSRAACSCGSDFFLAFSPEREDPGNERYSHRHHPEGGGRRRRTPATTRQPALRRGRCVADGARVVRARPPRRRSSPRTSSARSTSRS